MYISNNNIIYMPFNVNVHFSRILDQQQRTRLPRNQWLSLSVVGPDLFSLLKHVFTFERCLRKI